MRDLEKIKSGTFICEKQVLAPFCASKEVEMIVPHPLDDQQPSKILISLISTFCLQIVAFEDMEFKKLGSRGAAPPGTNSKPQIPTVFPITKFSPT